MEGSFLVWNWKNKDIICHKGSKIDLLILYTTIGLTIIFKWRMLRCIWREERLI